MPRTYERKCHHDGTLNDRFRPDTRGGDRHKPGPRARGKHQSKWQRGRFVAWDSEGADIAHKHECIVLLNSESGQIVDADGISTRAALDLLCDELHEHRNAIHVGFVFSYDVNMILRDLPRERVSELWKLGATRVRARGTEYRIRYRPRKEFAVWRIRDNVKMGGVLWDVFGFFQSSFVAALESYGMDKATIERIKNMKDKRSTFRPEQLPDIIKYCREECVLLVELMEKVYAYLGDAELPISRWDGAGAVAGALLRREKIKTYKGELPERVEVAARHAYFGGRIELLHFGHDEKTPVFEADIRSAYPAAAVRLPCLACGAWSHTQGRPAAVNDFTMVRVRWNLPKDAPFFPFPWRSQSDGNVYFPPRGEGWYWAPEVRACEAAWGQYAAQYLESYSYSSECDHEPFAFVRELYRVRSEWKRSGVGAEKMLKLGLNSLYGKLAQRVGGGKDGKPPYHNIAWAGYITSYTRARLHEIAWETVQQGRVLMFATDAIYSDVPAVGIRESSALGDWETAEYTGGTFVQSGVYWTRDDKPKIRGFDRGTLSREGIVDAWRRRAEHYDAELTRFIGMGRALIGGDWWHYWRSWRTEPRKLGLNPKGKREYAHDEYGSPLAQERPWERWTATAATDPAHERERQGYLSAPTEPPGRTGNASAVQQAIRQENECLEI